MGWFDIVREPLTCPLCGRLHTNIQTRIAEKPRLRDLRVGDPLELAGDLDERYTEISPPGDGRVVIIETVHCENSAWLVIVVEDGRIADIELRKLGRELLNAAHYVSISDVQSWSHSQPNPRDWADRVYSRDTMRTVRLQVLVGDVMEARNMREIALCLDNLECVAAGPAIRETEGPRELLRYECAPVHPPARSIELVFAIEDETPVGEDELMGLGGSAASTIVSPEFLAERVDELSGWVPENPLGFGEEDVVLAGQQLRQAILYAEDLLRFIPEGESIVPEHLFWSDEGLDDLKHEPERFERAEIQRKISEWTRSLADNYPPALPSASPPRPTPESPDE